MIKLKSILLSEDRTQRIDMTEAIEICKEKCQAFIHNDLSYIYRGLTYSNMFGKIDPSQFVRSSRNTANYYTLMLDNFDSWKKYPKRSKSVICSTRAEVANSYGNNTCIVVPYDTAQLGVCPNDDIWHSFNTIQNSMNISSLSVFNDVIHGAWTAVVNQISQNPAAHGLSDYTYADFYYQMQMFDDNTDVVQYVLEESSNTLQYNFIKSYLYNDVPMIEFLEDLLDPDKNEFKLIPYDKFSNTDESEKLEVWTDSPCLLLSISKKSSSSNESVEKFFEAIGKNPTK
jgi:hypothetical protein